MNWRRDLIAIVVVCGFITAVVIVLRGGVVDPSMKEVALVLLGNLSGAALTIVNYHYGSSAGSAAKDETINKVTKP